MGPQLAARVGVERSGCGVVGVLNFGVSDVSMPVQAVGVRIVWLIAAPQTWSLHGHFPAGRDSRAAVGGRYALPCYAGVISRRILNYLRALGVSSLGHCVLAYSARIMRRRSSRVEIHAVL